MFQNSKKSTDRVGVIVDGYSTGKTLAEDLKKNGIECLHIKSSQELPQKYKHNEDRYIANIIFDGDIEKLLKELESYFKIEFCIPGYESGVELADVLSAKLNLSNTNGIELSKARRDKFIMTETIRNAGIEAIEQIESANLNGILEWINKLDAMPIVLKPLDSANGDGVYFCHDKEQIKEAFKKNYFIRQSIWPEKYHRISSRLK